ncbi:MAG: hypothetical protein HOC74_12870 [Gemmatimonadetes bacterium]|jgi:hypothetical protein|nr:hypothetical protein [Gemmatimonadota bacterium]
MLKNLISAFLVFRLECRQLAVDVDLVLSLWRQRPAIEIVLERRAERAEKRAALRRKLDEVYPF